MTDTPLSEDPRLLQISDTVRRVLGAGPADIRELLAACRSGALTTLAADYGEDETAMFDEVLFWTEGVWTAGDRVARVDTLLAGAVFTHRLTADDIESGVVSRYPDLTVLDADVDGNDAGLEVAGGALEIVPTVTDHPHLDGGGGFAGPAGWLDGYSPGDVIAFRRSTAEAPGVTIDRAADVHADVVTAQALEEVFGAVAGSGVAIGIELFPGLLDAMVAHPDAFRRATLPIRELLEQLGCEYRDEYVGPAGATWQPQHVVERRARRARIGRDFGFDVCCDTAFETVLEAWSAFIGDGRMPEDADVTALDHSGVAPAFVEWELRNGGTGSSLLERFAEALIATHSRHRAAAHYLRAMNRRRNGDDAGAEADLRAATTLDPDNPFVALELAGYAAIRGNGKEAIRLMRRAGATPENDTNLAFLAGMFERYADTSRNDPCPCGSGRKYKVCCAVRPRLSDADRLRWLQRKLYEFAVAPGRVQLLWNLAEEAAAELHPAEDNIDALLDEAFLLDLAAFELSMEDFTARYGTMLPDDERDLLDAWRRAPRRLWEVTAVDADADRITLRDAQTGDTATVLDLAAAGRVTVGELVLARVAEGFGHDRLVGVAQPVDRRHRDSLIEILEAGGDARPIAAWFGVAAANLLD